MQHYRVFIIGALLGLAAAAGLVTAHEWKAPQEAAEMRNPLPVNEVNISAGETLYRQHCSSCHGEDMLGMTAEGTGVSMMAAPDLIKNLKMHSEGGFFWKIREGRGDMPAFKEVLKDDEIWSIVTAIKQAAGEK